MSGWPPLSDRQRVTWLQLIRTPRVGPSMFRDLINLFGTAEEAISALPDLAARGGKPLKPFARADAEREIENASRLGARFVAPGEPGYPPLITVLEKPPPLLCALVRDDARERLSSRPHIAIVGARNASAGGLTLARNWSAELAQEGFVIVSGLARGIDAAAHLGALENGTVAFHAGGLARPYPAEHDGLMRQIKEKGGAVYSEMPLEWSARAQDFPRRNRLVAGASYGLIVVEAAARSGSLITAGQAADMGRLVMVVPGFPLDPRSEGPNALLRDGATPVTTPGQVIEELAPLLGPAGSARAPSDAMDEGPMGSHEDGLLRENASGVEPYRGRQHLDGAAMAPGVQTVRDDLDETLSQAMSVTPIPADALVQSTGAPASAVRAWLLVEELAGRIERSPGDRFALRPGAMGT